MPAVAGDTPICLVDGDERRCVGCAGDNDCQAPLGECVAEVCLFATPPIMVAAPEIPPLYRGRERQ